MSEPLVPPPSPVSLSPAEQDAARPDLERIQALQRGHTDRDDEAEILEILGRVDGPRLNWLLAQLDLYALRKDVDDRRWGPDNLTALLGLLTSERVAELTVASRARLIAALQRGHTPRQLEQAAMALLLATPGRALTELKRAVDAGTDHRDLQQLLYHDVDHEDLRAAALEHIARHAVSTGELKVLSDLDDTLYPNWKDSRWPGKQPYPGVRAFYQALDRARRLGDTLDDEGLLGDLAFVTARPGDRPGLVEGATHRTLTALGLEAVVLAGGFTSLHGNEAIARRKYLNFEQYMALFPEYRFVFVGDSGQGDAMFGARMRAEHPDMVPAVFIHDVVATPKAARADWRSQGVHFFDTYPGAATVAHELGLITDRGLNAVTQAALSEFAAFEFSDEAQARERRGEIDRDVAAARARLTP
jgi:Phosphatidate phosphatase APP1, catalytic domain